MNERHGITEQQWMEFCEGIGDASQTERIEAHLRERIEAHLRECGECSLDYREMKQWNERLAAEGEKLRIALELPEAVRERMLAESLGRVSAAAAGLPQASPAERIARLRSLLAPVFGIGAVRATMDAALRRAAPGGISAANWKAFVAQLSDAIQSICGQAAGHLAERAALSLAVTE